MRSSAPTRVLVRHGDRTVWLEFAPDDPPQRTIEKMIVAFRAVGMSTPEITELLTAHAARLSTHH